MIQDIDQSPKLSWLESSILARALAGNDGLLEVLRGQVAVAIVESRIPSGVGFMTKLRLPADVNVLEQGAEMIIPIVRASHPQLEGGAEFLVQIKGGKISCIEAYCYEGMWPADESLFDFGQC